MPIDKISMRQLLVLLFAALLSPAIGALPGRTAALAGRGGWLSALVALPLLLGLCWILFALFQDRVPGEGLGEIVQAALGPVAGKLVVLVYLLWGIILLGVNARRFALRFLSTSYRNASLALFVIVLLGLALWIALGKLGALVRAGEVFYLALTIVLGLTLFLAIFRVEAPNVLPIWWEDVPRLAESALPVLSVFSYMIYGAFLAGGVIPKEGNRKKAMMWIAAFCGMLTLLQFCCMGSFGPTLVERMDAPFFMTIKGIGAEGAFERVESVVVALWVLSDLALLGMLLFACRMLCRTAFAVKDGRGAVIPVTALALGVSLFLFPDSFALNTFIERVVGAGGLVLGFVVPALVLAIDRLGKRLSRGKE